MYEAWVLAMVVVFLGLAAIGYVARLFTPTPQPRRDERIPRREYELLGEDYRDVVADYFARKAERDERRERAIRGGRG